jgi:branched-chain amino acid transport system substrate-binding protein
MHVKPVNRWTLRAAAATAACGLLTAVGLGSVSSSASSVLGTPHKATGTPIVFAMINLEGAPVSFPNAHQSAQAAIDYVNQYLDGINNHPIKLDECSNTTLEAPASATCANELVADNPTLVLGATDTGGAGSFPIWQAHHLAYIGGAGFTPVENNAPNSIEFLGIAGPDNVAALSYAQHTLHSKNVSVIESNDSQGVAVGQAIAAQAIKDGMKSRTIPLSDTASTSDFAAAAAQAESSHPDLVYIEVPNECPQTLIALQQTGYKGKLIGIGPCGAAESIKAAGKAANGLIYADPNIAFDQADTKAWGNQIAVTNAVLAKYAPPNMIVDNDALATFGAVMNLHTTLDAIKGPLNESSILKAFETGSNHPNWLAHPYTCNHKQVPSQTALCNGYEWIVHVQNGRQVTLDHNWVNGG